MEYLSDKILIVDTSSIIQVKDAVKGGHNQDKVLSKFTEWCNGNRLIFPREVCSELDSYEAPDRLNAWSSKNKAKACRFGHCHEQLSEVMNHPIAQLTVDPSKSLGKEDADPHVLATAITVSSMEESIPVIVTEESNKKIPFVPLNVAAGALGFTSINLYALLLITKVWMDDFRQK